MENDQHKYNYRSNIQVNPTNRMENDEYEYDKHRLRKPIPENLAPVLYSQPSPVRYPLETSEESRQDE